MTKSVSLPDGWVACTLGDIIQLEYGKSLPAKRRDPGGTINVYGSNGCVGLHSEALVDGPCLIVGRKGTAGAVEISQGSCWPIDTTYFVRSSSDLEIRFLYFLLNSLRLKELDRSTAVPGLNRDDAHSLEISLPPLNEQRRIVEKIETLFAQLDKGEEGLREVQKLLARYRQSVLKAAVTEQLTADWRAENSASDWRTISVGNVTSFLTSGSRGWAKYYSDKGDIFVRAQNLKHDILELDDVAHVSLPEKTEGKRTQVLPGDVLITITGANVTKAALVDQDLGIAYVSQHVALLRPSNEVLSEFLYWFLVAEAGGRKQLEKHAYGAGKPGLNLQNIRDVRFRLPSLDEQQVVVDRIHKTLARQQVVLSHCVRELSRSNALRQSILKAAFSGRLVAQVPDDEPAAGLLNRINTTTRSSAKPRANHRFKTGG